MKKFEPEIDWIGDWPVMHGERDRSFNDPDYCACLCGEDNYLMCTDESGPGSIMNLTIRPDGVVSDTEIDWR